MKKQLLITALLFACSMGLSPAWAFNNSPLQGIHEDIQSDMEEDEPTILPGVEILWRHTLERSPTLQLALQKMAEKTGKLKPKDKASWTRRMLQGMIQMGGLGGSVLAGNAAPMLGSTVLGRITAPDETPKELTQVTSADLVILAREIEQTQGELILSFLQYRQARQQEARMQVLLDELQNQSKTLPQDSSQLTDAIRTLLMQQALQLQQAHESVQTYRNLLVLAAGEEGVAEVDKVVNNTPQKPQEPAHAQPQPIKTPQG